MRGFPNILSSKFFMRNLTNLNIWHEFKPCSEKSSDFILVIQNRFLAEGAIFLNQLMAFAAVTAPALLALTQTKPLGQSQRGWCSHQLDCEKKSLTF